MGIDLKAENLSISVPNHGCNKNCPYCVSRMTGYVKSNFELMKRNLKKVVKIAECAEVTSVMFIGKGEPTYGNAYSELLELSEAFVDFPLELQTNGIEIFHNNYLLETLANSNHRFNVIAVSMDSDKQFKDYASMFPNFKNYGLISRITVNLTDMLYYLTFKKLIEYCIEFDVRQLTLRNVVIPSNSGNDNAQNWIYSNTLSKTYERVLNEAMEMISKEGVLLRNLNHGVKIFDVRGVSFSYSDYCIQENSNGNNVRSLIFLEDGHLYTSWNSRASVIF